MIDRAIMDLFWKGIPIHTRLCPVCGKEYAYLNPETRPDTCGEFECLQKNLARRIEAAKMKGTDQ